MFSYTELILSATSGNNLSILQSSSFPSTAYYYNFSDIAWIGKVYYQGQKSEANSAL